MKRERAPRPSRLVDLLMRACVLPFLVRRYRVSAARLAGPHHPQAALQNREKLEFYYDNGLYRLDFRNPRASPYAWTKTGEFLSGRGSDIAGLMRARIV